MAQHVRLMAALVVVAALSAGCAEGAQSGTDQGEGQAPTEAASSPPPSSRSTSPSPEASSSAPSSPDETETSASPDGQGGDDTDPPIVTGASSAPQSLTLVDFFSREGWEEREVQVPRQQEAVQAITTELGADYDTDDCQYLSDWPSAPILELRLAAESGNINMTVSQALDSATSDTLLDVKLLADGRTVDTTTVPFAESRELTVAVDGVSSVKLQIAASQDGTSCSTTVVVRDVELTGG